MSKYLMFVGDIHGDWLTIPFLLSRLKNKGVDSEAVFQVGDFGLYEVYRNKHKNQKKLESSLYITHGNHEEEEVYLECLNGESREKFTVLKQGEILEIAGVRLMSVGGAPCVDNPPTGQYVPFDANDYLNAIGKWEEEGKPHIDFLLTHEAPTGTGRLGLACFGDPYSCGIPQLRTLCETVKPAHQIGGHYHKFHFKEELDFAHWVLPVGQKGCLLYNIDKKTFYWYDIAKFSNQVLEINPDNLILLHRTYDGKTNFGY